MESIGARIRQARLKKLMTQAELGSLLGVSQNAVHNWENERNEPSTFTIKKIASALGVPAAKLIGEEPDVQTNLDRLRTMTEDELVKLWGEDFPEQYHADCYECPKEENCEFAWQCCPETFRNWLRSKP